jgi:ESCRT-I complex subunit TSG101
MPPPSTQSWLRENARFYSNPQPVYADTDALLTRFPQIRPKTDVYSSAHLSLSPSHRPQLIPFSTAYDDGRTQLLLCLHGTLPITYRQATYNIPVAIWITRDYPKEHPIPYVVATPGMLIRSSQYIDLSGRCNIEYIRNWQRKSEV